MTAVQSDVIRVFTGGHLAAQDDVAMAAATMAAVTAFRSGDEESDPGI